MPTILPFVRGDASNKAKSAAQGAAKSKSSGGSSSGGMKGLQAKLGGGGNKQPSPAESIAELAGKRLVPGHSLPHVTLHTVQGGVIEVGAPTGKWQLIVVYRGKHCPVSRNYLASLQQIIYELDDLGVEVLALTADGREKAEAFLDSLRATTETKEITYRIAYGLKLADMHKWGLYVSHPRNIRETEHPFPEPAMFLMNPEGKVQVAEYSNSPFCRPDLRIMIEGIRYIEENDYPVRGTYGFSSGTVGQGY